MLEQASSEPAALAIGVDHHQVDREALVGANPGQGAVLFDDEATRQAFLEVILNGSACEIVLDGFLSEERRVTGADGAH